MLLGMHSRPQQHTAGLARTNVNNAKTIADTARETVEFTASNKQR